MAWLYWDPNKNIFTVPYLNHPIGWYGLFFVIGLILSYWIVLKTIKNLIIENDSKIDRDLASNESLKLTDRLTWFVIAGIVIGARLGHVLFYDFNYYKHFPLEIIKIWEGGLASHGGAIGILLAIFLYRLTIKKQYKTFGFWSIVDVVAVPTALCGAFIRLGNFFNQEILGTTTTLPWGVIFGHPADKSVPTPRHPVQLYEAFAYLILFSIMYYLWNKTKIRHYPGLTTGIFFVLLFSSRFVIEFFKASQSHMIDESVFQTGQLLSIPFIIAGFLLIYYSLRRKEMKNHN